MGFLLQQRTQGTFCEGGRLIESKLTSVFDFYGIFWQFSPGALGDWLLFDLGWKWNDKMYHLQMIRIVEGRFLLPIRRVCAEWFDKYLTNKVDDTWRFRLSFRVVEDWCDDFLGWFSLEDLKVRYFCSMILWSVHFRKFLLWKIKQLIIALITKSTSSSMESFGFRFYWSKNQHPIILPTLSTIPAIPKVCFPSKNSSHSIASLSI